MAIMSQSIFKYFFLNLWKFPWIPFFSGELERADYKKFEISVIYY